MARAETSQQSLEVGRETVVEAALKVVDAEGVEALTMRRLASDLEIGLATLYRLVRSRDDVLDGIAELLAGEADVAIVAGEPWQETIKRNSRSYRSIAQRHPQAFHLIALRRSEDPAVLPHVAKVLALLQAAGFTDEQALLVNTVTDAYNSGFALMAAQAPPPESPKTLSERETELLTPPLRLQLQGMMSDDAFEQGLELIVAGIDAVLARTAARM